MSLIDVLKSQLDCDVKEYSQVKERRTKKERKRANFLLNMINKNISKINKIKDEQQNIC